MNSASRSLRPSSISTILRRYTRDEEGSLFPRLRQNKNAENTERLAVLDQLHAEHNSAGRRHHRIDELGSEWLNNGQLSPDNARLLNELLEDLSMTYANHISLEEQEIFPLAASLLDHAEMEAIAREMASRRGLALEQES